MKIIKVKDYEEMSDMACSLVADKITTLKKPVLGLATGSTPEGLYARLIERYKKKELSFQNVVTFNLDEYVGLEKEDPHSYSYFMHDKLFNHVDIPKDQIHIPNGMADDLEWESRQYEQMIQDAGHIDLQLLGIGKNGHIGFNEPGTPFTRRTHLVELSESTREANARFFDSIEDVPHRAITMGVQTIMDCREIVLIASGKNKADALAAVIKGEITEQVPASALQNHSCVTVIADEDALAKLGEV